MLFGSVPTPPKNPKSSMSTQSAKQSTVPATTASADNTYVRAQKPRPK